MNNFFEEPYKFISVKTLPKKKCPSEILARNDLIDRKLLEDFVPGKPGGGGGGEVKHLPMKLISTQSVPEDFK